MIKMSKRKKMAIEKEIEGENEIGIISAPLLRDQHGFYMSYCSFRGHRGVIDNEEKIEECRGRRCYHYKELREIQ